MQHGSAPAALVTWAAEAIPAREPMRIARVTIDLMRPVPLAPLTLHSEVLREGRKIQLCAVRLLAGDTVVVGATILKIRAQELTLPSGIADRPVDLPGPDQSQPEPADFSSSPFVTGVSLRAARGRFGVPGPGAIWYRVDRPMVEGFRFRRPCAPWSPRISATAPRPRWIFGNGPLSMPISPSVWRASRWASGFCSMVKP